MTDLSNETLARWEEDAKKATQGSWNYDWGNWSVESELLKRAEICTPELRNDFDLKTRIEEGEIKSFNLFDADISNGLHIANACPKNFLTLIAEVKRLRKDNDSLRLDVEILKGKPSPWVTV